MRQRSDSGRAPDLEPGASPLDRRFEAVVFDWDGTAVPDRDADAGEVREVVEELCARGVHVAVVSGTHVGNVDGQLAARPAGPGRLWLALNRGSEVFEVDGDGAHLVHRREATADEDAALDRAAARTIEALAARGLDAEVVSQRLNRRKIDMIPLPEWVDPPKARIDALLDAVQARLGAAGIEGLPAVVEIALDAARDAGLTEARVTTDAKHVEIGLTDKADSAREVFARLWQVGIAPELCLIAGDEVGPLGGLPGSDSLMLVDEAAGAVAVSVGVEPAGVPDGVIHVHGGPETFLALLRDQLRRRDEREVPDVALRDGWSLVVEGVEHERERANGALLTIADGRMGVAAAPLLGHPSAVPSLVVAGAYDGHGARLDLLELPPWDRLPGRLPDGARVWRALDLRTGVLAERVEDGHALRSVRFCALARPGTGVLRVQSRDEELGLPPDAVGVTRVQGEGLTVAIAQAQSRSDDRRALDRFAVYGIERPGAVVEGGASARSRVDAARRDGFEVLLTEQRSAWSRRWETADVRIEGDDRMQLAVRLGLYHLMGSVGDEGEAAVGARGLTGHAYRGHVFWDGDVFVLPFLAATHPAAARAMLEYRVRRLPAALAAALAEGRAGARFPWESGPDGTDVTPRAARDQSGQVVPIRTGDAEVHIVADVAWAASFYLDWTDDEAFAAGAGHRLFVETARYWASRARDDSTGRAHVYGVIGPDEYHEPVDDNMFTNVMARWNLRRAVASAEAYGGVDDEERDRWIALADALVDGLDPETLVYEQFAGFRHLEPLVVAEVVPRRPIVADLVLGRERVRGAQVIKQPDVLMAAHLVPDECAPGSLVPNLDYYEPRTAHGSSLSPGIHASLLARSGRLDDAMHWFRIAATIDLDDVTETTAGGLHLATMGSVWQALAFGFAGLRVRGDALEVDPHLPDEWSALELRVCFRGVPVRVRVTARETTMEADAPVRVVARGVAYDCGPAGITLREPS